MSYNKYYSPTTWEDFPSENTAIDAQRLNHLEDGVDELDDRICMLDVNKSQVSWNQQLLAGDKIAEISINGVVKNVYAPNVNAASQPAKEAALVSEAWAVGTRNGQAVPSTDPAYNNNSKYWSENIVQTNTRDDADLVKYIPRQYLNPDNAILGYYKHNSKEIAASNTAYHYEPFRIYKDIKYSFRQMYAYFCTFFYDDGTYEAISSTTGTHEDQLVTAAKDGWCYATVQGTFINNAKIYSNVDVAYEDIPFIGFNKMLRVNPTSIVHSGNYSSVLPTLADAKENSIYRLVTSRAMTTGTGTMTDVPYELKQDSQCVCTLFMIGNTNSGGGAASQILVTETGRVYFRFRNLVSGQVIWTDWVSTSKDTIVVAADGSGDFTSLTQALKSAVLKEGTYVYVKKGTYDIIQEYKDLYGNDFFDNYTESTADTGIELKNRVTVDFAPNSFVQCIYDGNNTYVQNRFAPMISGEKGFTLINCNITSKKVRYGFHDERAQSTDYYHNKYIGCHFNHDKGGGSGYIQTIGGGLGVNGLVEIDNCIFENASSTGNILSWHNSKASEARSQIFVRNSMVKGTIRFSYYGTSTLVSTMFVNGCKMYTDPIITQETQDYNTVNVEVLAWGNDVGTF